MRSLPFRKRFQSNPFPHPPCWGSRAWSKARDSRSLTVGFQGFESLPQHHIHLSFRMRMSLLQSHRVDVRDSVPNPMFLSQWLYCSQCRLRKRLKSQCPFRNQRGGSTDFIRLREDGHPVVDKTMSISRTMSDRTNKAILFCRPPGFGKSLSLSMLDAFLNIRYRGNTWFDGMSIRDDRGSDVFRNAFPVIRIDLNSISVEDQDELERSMDRLVGSAFRDHSYLESSERLPRYMRSDYSRMARSEYGSDVLDLFQLSEMLQVHHGAQAVVLVDGYDSPVVSSIGKPCFQEVRNLTGRMLLSVLKDNPHVGKAFLMGVCCVSYPGLNNLALSTTMDGADSRTASA